MFGPRWRRRAQAASPWASLAKKQSAGSLAKGLTVVTNLASSFATNHPVLRTEDEPAFGALSSVVLVFDATAAIAVAKHSLTTERFAAMTRRAKWESARTAAGLAKPPHLHDVCPTDVEP